MNIDITYKGIPMSNSLNGLIIGKLQKISKESLWLRNAGVFFVLDNNKENINKSCHLRLGSPGINMFAASTEVDFEKLPKELFLDSTTVHVIRKLKHRVLAVPVDYHYQKVAQVLLPTDYVSKYDLHELEPLLAIVSEKKSFIACCTCH